MALHLGIDTSNYTSSLAIYDSKSGEHFKKERPLEVEPGSRGLRQNDAQFLHLKNLPALFDELFNDIDIAQISSVGVSAWPRRASDSYMPCFLQGVFAAKMISASLKVPYAEFSHQEGHIASGIISRERFDLFEKEFLALHLSGGTTEILHVKPSNAAFDIERVGGTKDLNVGQLVDRVGVMMGFPFPSGKHLDDISAGTSHDEKIKTAKKGAYFNLSGYENMAKDLFERTNDPKIVSAFLFKALEETLSGAIECVIEKYDCKDILLVGGVMANSTIRSGLMKFPGAVFCDLNLCVDNAVGISYLASSV